MLNAKLLRVLTGVKLLVMVNRNGQFTYSYLLLEQVVECCRGQLQRFLQLQLQRVSVILQIYWANFQKQS
ncbi:hypothetical protein Y032_0100g3274 [Ancylostoma ceylanicum]|uniref:Uncharacterized protein n=1 Tax=Ancylostoma ceylanicum TaxID=53326 RepID=A0A016TII5_9BILA|nr:hypothetical protein Y032_0100g3274 [Ancylostoma ceylanicum]